MEKSRTPVLHLCGRGGTGRRAGFRIQCRKAWRFDPSRPHHREFKRQGETPCRFSMGSWVSNTLSIVRSYQKTFENTLSGSYSRFSDSFHIIYIVRWKVAEAVIFSNSALFQHQRMFLRGRIFVNRVVYNMLSQEC